MSMGEKTNNGNLEPFLEPITVDSAIVTIHFALASETESDDARALNAIKEILLASYHAD
jgi:hypothetical protein